MSVITHKAFKDGYLGVKRRKFETTFVGLARVIPIELSPGLVTLAIKAPRSMSIARDDTIARRNPHLSDDQLMDRVYKLVDDAIALANAREPEDLVGDLDAVALLTAALICLSGDFEPDGVNP